MPTPSLRTRGRWRAGGAHGKVYEGVGRGWVRAPRLRDLHRLLQRQQRRLAPARARLQARGQVLGHRQRGRARVAIACRCAASHAPGTQPVRKRPTRARSHQSWDCRSAELLAASPTTQKQAGAGEGGCAAHSRCPAGRPLRHAAGSLRWLPLRQPPQFSRLQPEHRASQRQCPSAASCAAALAGKHVSPWRLHSLLPGSLSGAASPPPPPRAAGTLAA